MSKSADSRGAAGITATRIVAAVIVLQGIATIVLHGTWHEPLFLRRREALEKSANDAAQRLFAHDTASKAQPPEAKATSRLLPTKREMEMNPAPMTKRQPEMNPKPPAKRQGVSTHPNERRNAPMPEPPRTQGQPVKDVWIPPARPVGSLWLRAG